MCLKTLLVLGQIYGEDKAQRFYAKAFLTLLATLEVHSDAALGAQTAQFSRHQPFASPVLADTAPGCPQHAAAGIIWALIQPGGSFPTLSDGFQRRSPACLSGNYHADSSHK